MKNFKFKLYKSVAALPSQDLTACQALLNHCQIPFDVIVDQNIVTQLSNGLYPPAKGYIIVTPNGEKLQNCIRLAYWIHENGYELI